MTNKRTVCVLVREILFAIIQEYTRNVICLEITHVVTRFLFYTTYHNIFYFEMFIMTMFEIKLFFVKKIQGILSVL